ncbi:transmembrane adaptor Erv26-domain-containing protein [Irpex rosettiformis]|uniref:Transmembrane adaptor Erv26-domain-containing protein n=1 Tax=Irpex rosettiformis TaxID=378272 RepID=A0ACB8U4H3_9APHY|nr:transmembrane adaptor Erv26-domain-containing protein [Irpex rosettiformis]
MTLLHYLSYGGAIAAFVFVTLSLASGLLWLSELIEEHSRVSKSLGQRGIYIIILLHVLLYFSDSLPLHLTLFSVACHVVYLQNFSANWPMVSLSSLTFIASCILVVVDHFLWFFYFARVTQDARHRARTGYRGQIPAQGIPGFSEIATFFGVCVWLAPLFLFLSLSANDSALPMMNFGNDGAIPSAPSKPASTASRGSLFKTLYDALPLDSLPRMRPKTSRDASGIIAPPSPVPRPVPSPLPSPSLHRVPSMTSLPPPRSPMSTPRTSHETPRMLSPDNLDGFTSPDQFSSFSLGSPPNRIGRVDRSPVRRTTTDGSGRLGMRRISSHSSAYD